jgi:hypothetical protein
MDGQFGKYICKKCGYIGNLVIEEVNKEMKKKKQKKNPWIAALLNFLFYGAGYIYARKRKALGWGLIIIFVVMSIEFLLGDISHIKDPINTHLISMTLLSVVLACDGYKVVKEKNG